MKYPHLFNTIRMATLDHVAEERTTQCLKLNQIPGFDSIFQLDYCAIPIFLYVTQIHNPLSE